jgi:lysophospholipase L1-like esterase
MKNIFCYGDSNTWGCKPGSYDRTTQTAGRYSWNERWPGILQQALGEDYHITENGRNGRTTQYDYASFHGLNSKEELASHLESHYPLDLVIVALGTNDTKTEFNASAKEISEGIRTCVRIITESNKGVAGKAPKVLIVAPQAITKIVGPQSPFDDASIEKSRTLADFYKKVAEEEQCEFLNAGDYVLSSPTDGGHLDAQGHQSLAKAIAGNVKEIFTVST